MLSKDEEKKVVQKLIKLTNEKDLYQQISLLEIENQNLKNEIKLLKQQQKIKEESESEYELE